MENTSIELSTKKGSLAYCLNANKTNIEASFNNKSISAQAMQTQIRDLVIAINDKPLDKKSVATKRFLNSLAKQRSKYDILKLVWNTILAGDGEAVLK